MSLEKNKAIARRYQEEVWGKGDLALIDELVAADFVDHSLPAGMDPSFAGARRAVKGALDAFPDGQVQIDRTFAAGDYVCVEFTGRGTHTGTLRSAGGEIAATGRSITLHLCDVVEVRNARIHAVRSYFDSASLMMQIGAMPELQMATTNT